MPGIRATGPRDRSARGARHRDWGLLGRYWSLSPAHASASVVLADARAWERLVMQ